MMKKSNFKLAAPKGGGSDFYKLVDGENKVRIVSEIIAGHECWSRQADSNEVHRQEAEFTDQELKDLGVTDSKQKQFYACVVWDYNTKKFVCWVITQMGIKEYVYGTVTDEDWGDPVGYDFAINKSGAKLETKYNVMAKPHKKFTEDVSNLKYNLTNLFGGGDPFSV